MIASRCLLILTTNLLVMVFSWKNIMTMNGNRAVTNNMPSDSSSCCHHFSVVPPSPNPSNKLTKRLLEEVLPNELQALNIQLLGEGGRLSFYTNRNNKNDTQVHPLFGQWTNILSPHAVKSLRLVVGNCSSLTSNDTEEDVLEKVVVELPETLPWKLYEAFGNAVSTTNQKSHPSSIAVTCRRWVSCCIPKSVLSATRLAQKLRQTLIRKWGSHPAAQTTDCELTLLLFDDVAWLEWTLLVPPPDRKAAVLDLPKPGFKRVEAWMLVQACLGDDIIRSIKHDDDDKPLIIMDPLCGKGTFLVEAATTIPNKTISYLGVDESETQLQDAALNVEATGCTEQIKLYNGDARRLDWLSDGSVTAILTCPPFGRQFGRGSDLQILYQEWIDEWKRLIDPQYGRIALLVDVDHQEDALAAIRSAGRRGGGGRCLRVTIHREPFRLGRLRATVIVAHTVRGDPFRSKSILSYSSSHEASSTSALLSRFPWEGATTKESRAEWTRLRAVALQELIPYTRYKLSTLIANSL